MASFVLRSHKRRKFLAINTQKNAGNHGYNTASKYNRADFLSVSEAELRLDFRDKEKITAELLKETSKLLDCKTVLATRGDKGCLCYDSITGIVDAPALSSKIKDRIGAGDAVFAIAAFCAKQNFLFDLVGFIANAIGTQAIEIIGNAKSINKVNLLKHISHLLK